MLCWRMRRQKGVALTFLSARVELDEKDESCDVFLFWWERQICPHPGGVGRGGGGAPLQCACAFGVWPRGLSAYRLSTGTRRCAGPNIREGISG